MNLALATLDAATVFSRCGLRHALGGGLASTIYGEMRLTLDADFAVALPPLAVDRFVRTASSAFHLDADEAREAARDMRMFSMTHKMDLLKIDVHVVPDTGHHKAEFDRARWIQIGNGPGDEVLVATAEDVLLQKLMWFRKGGEESQRQWRDVCGILKARSRNLDLGYLRGWAEQQGTRDLFERAWMETGGAPRSASDS